MKNMENKILIPKRIGNYFNVFDMYHEDDNENTRKNKVNWPKELKGLHSCKVSSTGFGKSGDIWCMYNSSGEKIYTLSTMRGAHYVLNKAGEEKIVHEIVKQIMEI